MLSAMKVAVILNCEISGPVNSHKWDIMGLCKGRIYPFFAFGMVAGPGRFGR